MVREVNGLHSLGTHLLLELRECNTKTLCNLELVQDALTNAALEAKATIVEVAFHEFSPFGISGMVVIAESHLAIHTWPEYDYAAVDVFTCGSLINPRIAANSLIEKFESRNHAIIEINRGVLKLNKQIHGFDILEAKKVQSSININHSLTDESGLSVRA